ncbi:MAG: tyrosine-type recombinase/integrase [Burkholderiales bacterium]|nr:tyrosine-type recombinase/integrase [Burkholderiales bacterium]
MTGWLWPEQVFALIAQAGKIDTEFRLLLIACTWCGLRLSEALGLACDDVRLAEAFAWLRDTKNGEPQPVHLPPPSWSPSSLIIRAGSKRPGERVFRFAKGGHVYSLLRVAAFRAEITLPRRQAFHLLRHTYATSKTPYHRHFLTLAASPPTTHSSRLAPLPMEGGS